MKYNPMGINRGLSPQNSKLKKKTQEILWVFSKKLLYVELNNLVESWGQVCRRPLATCVRRQILSKDNIQLYFQEFSFT